MTRPATGTPLRDAAWRLAFRLGFPVARAWWRVHGRPHQGALVAVFVQGALLLLRSSYRREWNLPGGGVWAGETPIAAARRELREEIGLEVPDPMPVRVFAGRWEGRPDRVHVFEAHLPALPPLRLDNREIVDARLFQPGEWAGLALTGPVAAFLQARAQNDCGRNTSPGEHT